MAELSEGSAFCLETPFQNERPWPWRPAQPAEVPADVLERASLIYSQILAKINHRYVLGYYPTNRARDGKRRKVQIQVRNHPEYVIESRGYYYAPTETSAQK